MGSETIKQIYIILKNILDKMFDIKKHQSKIGKTKKYFTSIKTAGLTNNKKLREFTFKIICDDKGPEEYKLEHYL